MDTSKLICMLSYALVIIGALAWGALGFLNYDIVGTVVGPENAVYVYDVIGIAGVVLLLHKAMKSGGMKLM